ncbi:MAG: hypothetical protein SFV54_23830 [Bryobacteraceae bacterium]|nr:hypothetical protein [Bryobacteraceae bacterium]
MKIAIGLVLAMSLSAAVKVEKVAYQGWPNCYRVTNGEVEVVVTSDIGPRIMRYAFVGGRNFFAEFKDALGKSGEKEWVARGGHRIWIGPEDPVYTYAPDNAPVQVRVTPDGLEATQPVEPLTGVEKQIVVKMASTGGKVEVIHRLTNRGAMPLEFAAWALTMMAPGGVGVTGLPPRGTHPKDLAPANPLVMWPYTDLSDPRWVFTSKYIVLKQDPAAKSPQKIGHWNPDTWGAYLLGGEAFLKRYKPVEAARHPDFGTSYQTFTNAEMLEIETMGPLVKLAPRKTVEHVEQWSLHRGVKGEKWTDAELDRALLPLLRQ